MPIAHGPAPIPESLAGQGDVTDDKGRPLVITMSDREVAEETLITLRAFADALAVLTENPMARMMMR